MAKQKRMKKTSFIDFMMWITVCCMSTFFTMIQAILLFIPFVNLIYLRSEILKEWIDVFHHNDKPIWQWFKTEYELVRETKVIKEIWRKV